MNRSSIQDSEESCWEGLSRESCSCANKPTWSKLAACNLVGSVIFVAIGQHHTDQFGSSLKRLPGAWSPSCLIAWAQVPSTTQLKHVVHALIESPLVDSP